MTYLSTLNKKLTLLTSLFLAFVVAGTFLFGNFFSQAQVAQELSVTLGADKTQITPGEQFQYTATFQNTGSEVLNGIMIAQNISSDVTYVSGSTALEVDGQQIAIDDNWISSGSNLGSLNPGQRMYFRFSVKMNDAVAADTVVRTTIQTKTAELPDWKPVSFDVRVVPAEQRANLRGPEDGYQFLKVNNNTLSTERGDSVEVQPYNVVEFFTTIINDGQYASRGTKIQTNLSVGPGNVLYPSVTITSDNADPITDTVEVRASEAIHLIYKVGHATFFGVTDMYNCPGGCAIPESFFHTPLMLGTIEPGTTASVQVNFKADVIPEEVQPSPSPTPSPVPSPTPSPVPSPTPSPIPSPTPSPVPSPTPTPSPSPSPTASPSPDEGGFIVLKYNDKDGDGTRDSDTEEPGLSWEFEWDLNGDNNWRAYQTYSDRNGEGGRVGGLHDGDRVRVREKSKDGWEATTGTQIEITVRRTQTITVRFGNREKKPQVTTVDSKPTTLPKTGSGALAMVFFTGLAGVAGKLFREYGNE